MTAMTHLARRFLTSLSHAPPPAEDAAWAVSKLLPAESELWRRMTVQDRRHSILVARRFVELVPDADEAEVAGALLHDVGKLAAGLGTFRRVLATLVGPRTARFRKYHDHERLGGEMLTAAGSLSTTTDLVQGRGPRSADLRRADDV